MNHGLAAIVTIVTVIALVLLPDRKALTSITITTLGVVTAFLLSPVVLLVTLGAFLACNILGFLVLGIAAEWSACDDGDRTPARLVPSRLREGQTLVCPPETEGGGRNLPTTKGTT